MSIVIVDYGSGNLRSAAKALEVANKNINANSKILITSDPEVIKKSNKIVSSWARIFQRLLFRNKKK